MLQQPQNFAPRGQAIPTPQSPGSLPQTQNFGPGAQQQMIPAPQGPQSAPQPQSFAPQSQSLPQSQNFSAPLQGQFAQAPQAPQSNPALNQLPTEAQENTNAAAPATNQMMSVPRTLNPLQGLADFLEKNVILSEEADRSEFARKLNALKNLGTQN
jgi:hypothetical protein